MRRSRNLASETIIQDSRKGKEGGMEKDNPNEPENTEGYYYVIQNICKQQGSKHQSPFASFSSSPKLLRRVDHFI